MKVINDPLWSSSIKKQISKECKLGITLQFNFLFNCKFSNTKSVKRWLQKSKNTCRVRKTTQIYGNVLMIIIQAKPIILIMLLSVNYGRNHNFQCWWLEEKQNYYSVFENLIESKFAVHIFKFSINKR